MKKTDDGEERKTIQVSAAAHAKITEICARRGIDRSVYKVLSRLILWYGHQPEAVQTSIAHDVDRGMNEAYAGVLEAMAKQLRATFTDPVDHVQDPAAASRDRIARKKAEREARHQQNQHGLSTSAQDPHRPVVIERIGEDGRPS